MKRLLKIAALPALAVALFAIVPAMSSAGTGTATPPQFLPPTADTGECQGSTRPTPPPGSSLGNVPGANSEPWVQRDQLPAKGEVGIRGDRGYLVVRGNQTGPTVTVQGFQNSDQSDLNGNATVTPNGATKAAACLSLQNQRVRVAVP